jgi:DNA polymerase (family X)
MISMNINMPVTDITNDDIANVLDRIADLLEAKDVNPHRVRAYRDGAASVRNAKNEIANWIMEGNLDKLKELPGIGSGLAGVISNYVKIGRSDVLDDLESEVSPENLFVQVPGIGVELAKRVREELKINTLEDLERAAYDGRLGQVQGFGEKRIRAVRMGLAGMLSSTSQRKQRWVEKGEEPNGNGRPTVGTLLEVDREYREKARQGELRKIAPKRFNPDNEAWLPILNVKRDGWVFTVLYSNTAQANKLGTTHDWVVIYYERDNRAGQATVVTKMNSPMKGKRVVRGREVECQQYYEKIK